MILQQTGECTRPTRAAKKCYFTASLDENQNNHLKCMHSETLRRGKKQEQLEHQTQSGIHLLQRGAPSWAADGSLHPCDPQWAAGAQLLDMVCTMGCRGTSALVSGAPPAPSFSTDLGFSRVVLSYSHPDLLWLQIQVNNHFLLYMVILYITTIYNWSSLELWFGQVFGQVPKWKYRQIPFENYKVTARVCRVQFEKKKLSFNLNFLCEKALQVLKWQTETQEKYLPTVKQEIRTSHQKC